MRYLVLVLVFLRGLVKMYDTTFSYKIQIIRVGIDMMYLLFRELKYYSLNNVWMFLTLILFI